MKRAIVVISLLGLLLAACGSLSTQTAATPEPTPIPAVITAPAIIAEGRLVPARSVQVSFVAGGQLSEVLVEEGDQVKAGEVLARLGNREELEAEIADAELELYYAQQALIELDENLPEAQTTALEELTRAKDALREAERKVGSLSSPVSASENSIEIARANVAIARKTLDKAKADYRPYENKPPDNLTRAALLQKKADAQAKYDAAVKKLNTLLGVSATDYAVDQAQAQLQIAQSRLELAQNKYDLLLDGPDPKEVEPAEARITAAEATLKATQAALDKLELRATIDGSVVDLNLIPGQQVSPAQVGMKLVDFSRWYVETDNLTEMQVVDIAPGQIVALVPDALRSVHMAGVVDSISNTFEVKGGDITYTVRILVEEIDPRLRWGMTVTTRFEVE